MKTINTYVLLILGTFITLCAAQGNFLSTDSDLSSEITTNEEFEQFRNFLLLASTDEPSVPSPSPPKPEPSVLDNLIGSFMKLTNGWSKIVEAFKTTRSSEIKKRILGKGFDYFKQSAQIQVISIKAAFLDNYLINLEKKIAVPEKYKSSLTMIIEECRWADSNVWNAFETMFDINNGGDIKFASIVVAFNDKKNTYDFLINDVQADFKLAPDVLVVSKKLSVLGGIWEDSKDEYVKVPKSLSTDDAKMVMQFFSIVAFKGFLEQFGMDVPFPKI
jgi:hypothetical protein